jgi:beta-glucuronidase
MELSRIAGSGQLEITVTARNDFPRYTLRNYTLKVSGRILTIPTLAPSESKTFVLEVPANESNRIIELVKPGGFVILRKQY